MEEQDTGVSSDLNWLNRGLGRLRVAQLLS